MWHYPVHNVGQHSSLRHGHCFNQDELPGPCKRRVTSAAQWAPWRVPTLRGVSRRVPESEGPSGAGDAEKLAAAPRAPLGGRSAVAFLCLLVPVPALGLGMMLFFNVLTLRDF